MWVREGEKIADSWQMPDTNDELAAVSLISDID